MSHASFICIFLEYELLCPVFLVNISAGVKLKSKKKIFKLLSVPTYQLLQCCALYTQQGADDLFDTFFSARLALNVTPITLTITTALWYGAQGTLKL